MNDKESFVVDMTQMQYGEVGTGIYGEISYLRGQDEYLPLMGKVCYCVADHSHNASTFSTSQSMIFPSACAIAGA
jgi:hypothetical protein